MPDSALLDIRRLDWPRCYNVRDLGGLPTACGFVTGGESIDHGQRTRWGAIVRMDYGARLNADGWRALVAHGVRTIIDLRSPWELDKEPYTVPPAAAAAGVVLIHRPLVLADPVLDAELSDPANSGREYAILAERCAANIAAILRAIVGARPGGVAIHCQAGKDRTGIIVALLLRLAGVPDDVSLADYAESEPRLWPVWEAMLAAGDADPRMKPLVFPEDYRNLLAHLDTAHGGVEGYLAAIGLTPGEVAALRERLVGDDPPSGA